MNGSLVSIITPCYNAERYLRKLLESVLAQDYKPIEFIIVDDGSTDGTLGILNSYADSFRERGVLYTVLSQSNQGAASAVNRGLELFTGDYVTFIDADDFLNESSISERVAFLEQNKEDYDAVYSDTNLVDASDYMHTIGTLKGKGGDLFLSMICETGYIWTHAYMIKASYFLLKHPTRKIIESKAGQNIQLFLPLWYKGRVGYVNKPLVTIVEHSDSHSRMGRSDDENRRRQREIGALYVETLRGIDMPNDERDKYISIIKERYTGSTRRVFSKIMNDKDELGRLYDYDERKFRNNYVSDIHSASQTQLAAKLVFSTHSLEKSLSNDNFEIGHGFHVAYLLTEMLNIYSQKGYDKGHLAYINTLSTLKIFYDRHKNTEYVEKIETILGDMLPVIEGCTSHIGGASSISRKQKKDNDHKNFKELAEGRYAIRAYSDKPVDKRDIEEVVSIATKTPTVCNRQGVRVYAMYEKDVIEKVLKVQGGIEFYDTPPVLLLITADDSFYVGPNERNQGFIDGGLFAMSMLYSLEYKGLAACPLHAMLDEDGEYAIRGMLDIPEGEKLITFMSTGHFNENNSVCKSFRYPVEHILSEKNEVYEYHVEEVLDKNDHVEEVSLFNKARRKLQARTRIKNTLKKIKNKTRIRTRVLNGIEALRYQKSWRRYTEADGVILTLSGYYNYGNMVQRYALQHFLRKNGYNFVSYTKDMPVTSEDDIRLKYTRSFVKRNIWQKDYDIRDKFKAYIVGSDQVWRKWGVDDIFDELGYFFLDFVKDREVKRISYAASIGQGSLEAADYTKEFIPHAKMLLSKFDHVSMRELSGVDIVKDEWGVDARQVIDPTLLLQPEDYNRIIDAAPYDLKTYDSLFVYVILTSEQKDMMIKGIARDAKLVENGIYLEEDKALPPVEEWLRGIRDSKLVVTDSFHGMVFSIIFNTPFIVLESGTGGEARVTTLLGKLGLLDRYIMSDQIGAFDIGKLSSINWNVVNKRLAKLRLQSAEWLLDAVQSK